MTSWPLFICECCTVRGILERELGSPGDRCLLRLERMRILDVANSWSEGTYKAYSSKLKYIRQFEGLHPGLNVLSQEDPLAPPRTEAIAIAWAELLYSLRESNRPDRDTVSFGTIRQLRSAVGWDHTVAALTGGTGLLYDERTKRLARAEVGATHEAILTRFTEGLKRRVGDDPRPSYALLERHVRAADIFCQERYAACPRRSDRLFWARMGLANTLLWLGWLRSSELFGLQWGDVGIIPPADGPKHDLPPHIGAILLRLNPLTKTDQASTVDVPVAYRTKAGFTPGTWAERVFTELGRQHRSIEPLFQHPSGRPWDSGFYREGFLYPLLLDLQKQGDPYLAPFKQKASPNALSIKQAFYSLHCYRRGARTHVELGSGGRATRANKIQIYEHARWSRSRSGEQIDVQYRQWPLKQRLDITLLCM